MPRQRRSWRRIAALAAAVLGLCGLYLRGSGASKRPAAGAAPPCREEDAAFERAFEHDVHIAQQERREQLLRATTLAEALGEAPPAAAGSVPDGGVPLRLADMEEDRAMVAAQRHPMQRRWRGAWSRQAPDEAWTQRMREQLRARGHELAGEVVIQSVHCHQTVCRAHVQFADHLDAMDYVDAQGPEELDFAFQSLDPEFDGEGFDRADYTYEVLVKRPTPAGGVVEAELEDEAVATAGSEPA